MSTVCHLAYLRKWLMDVFVQDTQATFFSSIHFSSSDELTSPTEYIKEHVRLAERKNTYSAVSDSIVYCRSIDML